MIHQTNILIHVTAGTIALIVGASILLYKKRSDFHKMAGKLFVVLLAIVTTTGFLGWLFFRSNAFLLMLTLLAGYNTYSGYRVIKLKQVHASVVDFGASIITLCAGVFYLLYLLNTDSNWSASVIYPTAGGIVLVTVYDIFKYVLLHNKLKRCWLYEHIYKIVSAFSAILSAFAGTVLPQFKPYSQIGPSTFCVLLIVYFMLRESLFSNRGAISRPREN